jgi:hypothetical protein
VVVLIIIIYGRRKLRHLGVDIIRGNNRSKIGFQIPHVILSSKKHNSLLISTYDHMLRNW